MNPNTMTCDECRDELARRKGLGSVEDGTFDLCRRRIDDVTDEREFPDPYPPTLDGAAGALPEGWTLVRIAHSAVWSAYAVATMPYNARMIIDAPDELTARYRLALCCVIAGEGKA